MGEFAESIIISAPIEQVWQTLADIGSIYLWNPGVKASNQTTSGEVGVGSCRHCNLGGKNFLDEEVVTFEPYNKIIFRITNTNMPFKTADIRFTLQPNGTATDVTVSPIYQLNYGLIGKLLDVVMVRSQYQKGMGELLQGLKEYVER